MPGAVGVWLCPYLPYPEEDIERIADYMFTHEILNAPEWFEDPLRTEPKKENERPACCRGHCLSYALATKQTVRQEPNDCHSEKKGSIRRLRILY